MKGQAEYLQTRMDSVQKQKTQLIEDLKAIHAEFEQCPKIFSHPPSDASAEESGGENSQDNLSDMDEGMEEELPFGSLGEEPPWQNQNIRSRRSNSSSSKKRGQAGEGVSASKAPKTEQQQH